MREELDEKLVTAFPNLYRDRNCPPTETAMFWGFECGDGWFDLIWNLSSKLEALILKLKDEKPGLYAGYFPAASQVKEKFGGLRFYMTTETDEMSDVIRSAEEKSYRTCELCGKPGQSTRKGWITTYCREHWPKDGNDDYDELEKLREQPDHFE